MTSNLILNPRVSYLEKDRQYAIYIDFNYLFLSGQAALYFNALLSSDDNSKKQVPESFIKYLLYKHIIEEDKT